MEINLSVRMYSIKSSGSLIDSTRLFTSFAVFVVCIKSFLKALQLCKLGKITHTSLFKEKVFFGSDKCQ